MVSQWQPEFDGRSRFRLTLDFAAPAQLQHALFHAGQPIAAKWAVGWDKTSSIIGHGNSQLVLDHFHLDENLGRARMANRIVERLLEGEKNTVAQAGIERCRGKLSATRNRQAMPAKFKNRWANSE